MKLHRKRQLGILVALIFIALLILFYSVYAPKKETEKTVLNKAIPTNIPVKELCKARRIILDETLVRLPDEDIQNFNHFLADSNIEEKHRDMAALLYFYPNGFVSSVADKITSEKGEISDNYLQNMLLNRHYFLKLPKNYEGKVIFYSSLYNFTFEYPSRWPIAAYNMNNFFALSPDTLVHENGVFYPWEEVFDVFFYQEINSDEMTFDEFIEKQLRVYKQYFSATPLGGPEKIDAFHRKNVIKYILESNNKNFPTNNYGGGQFRIEPYFFQESGIYHIIYFKYSTEGERWREEAENIAGSYKTYDEDECNEFNISDFAKKQLDIFYPPDDGSIESLYLESLQK